MRTHPITGTQKSRKQGYIGTLRLFTEYHPTLDNETLIGSFIKEVPYSKAIGYAGFTKKEHLRDNLAYNIPDFEDAETQHQAFSLSEPELLRAIEEALRLCHKNVATSPTNIFLFPTFSNFVKDKMGGVSGYTPYKNTLLLYISPQETDRWKEALTETICHEFMHTVMDNHYERKNLMDDLVFEGVAESFVSFLFGVKAHTPSQAIPLKETVVWYQKLKKRFRNTKLYYPVFLEGKEYPLWAGYAIGYQIVEAYRKQHPDITWDALVKLTPKEIHEEAKFGKKETNAKHRHLSYLLLDIEYWQHRAHAYPVKISYPFDGGLSIGMSYTVEQFSVAEEKIKNHFSKQGQKIDIMNPLYQFDGRAETTITVDILLNSETKDKTTREKEIVPTWFKEVQKLLTVHENRMSEIFVSGGDLSTQTKGTVRISNDKILHDIEETIQRHFSDAKKLAEIIKMVQRGSMVGTEALQWIEKDGKVINILIDIAGQPGTTVEQCNLILREFIPCVSILDKRQYHAIALSLEKLLLRATPAVRNKTLCILSELPAEELRGISRRTRLFIGNIADTLQLNCSYPAKEIIEKLKPLKIR